MADKNATPANNIRPIKTYFIPLAKKPALPESKALPHSEESDSQKTQPPHQALENDTDDIIVVKPENVTESEQQQTSQQNSGISIDEMVTRNESGRRGRLTQGILKQIDEYNMQRDADVESDFTRNRRNNYLRSLTEPPAYSIEYLEQVAEKGHVVDCTNTTKKTLAIISSLTNGNVKCLQPPDIHSFIEKRLNKD